MPRDLTLTTRGLPTPGGPTCTDRTFQWLFVDNTLTIPKYQCGQSEFCADDHEQDAWLGRHAAAWMRAVWCCVWEWNTPTARDEFLAALAPLDPQADAVARALRKLGRATTPGRREAAESLLELAAPNLAAAVPALTRAQRSPDPGLRALATALLYRWHHRCDPARIAPLFRDDDPIVRTAALREFQRDYPWQEESFVRAQLPFVLERLTDRDPAVRDQALHAVEVAASRRLVPGRRVLELRAELGPLVDSDGVDRTDALGQLADRHGPRTTWPPAMEAFYAALCAAELLRVELLHAPGRPRDPLVAATDRARALWQHLPRDAPDEVRLHDTRLDILQSLDPSTRPADPAFARAVEASRSPRREFDALAIYWIYQHTPPRGLPAEYMRPAPAPVERAPLPVKDDDEPRDADMDENMRSFLRHLE